MAERLHHMVGDTEDGQLVQVSKMPSPEPMEVKYKAIDAASSGDNEIVPAANGAKIRVHSLWVVSGGTVTTRWESGAGGTALTGQAALAVNTGYSLAHNPTGWFETKVGESLNLELSGAVSVDGSLTYTLVT